MALHDSRQPGHVDRVDAAVTVALKNNFFGNSRGLTLKDGGGIAWSINSSTNEITATGSAGGVISTITVADNSTTPIYTGSTVTGNGTLNLTLKTEAANLVFAGPSTGAAAQPTFRAMATADLPTGIPNANLANSSLTVTAGTGLSGGGAVSLGGSVTLTNAGVTSAVAGTNITVSGATGAVTINCSLTAANPTGSVGLAAVNGVAATFMRSDAAPALSQSISPTWSGNHTFTGSITVTMSGGSFIVEPAAESSFGGVTISNASASRTLELVYIGLSRAAAYGIQPGAVGINAHGGTLCIGLADIEAITFTGAATTGTATATFSATNKPGSNGSPAKWLPVKFGGTQYYIPMWS